MTQLSRDAFVAGEAPMRLDEATAALLKRVCCVAQAEAVPLAEAEGRILAEDLVAPIALPGFDNSAVDGYAVSFADLSAAGERVLEISGRAAAGRPLVSYGDRAPGAGATRIFTGAQMPPDKDTVFMQEDCRLLDGGRVRLPHGLSRGANRRLRGEDLAEGALALPCGRRLRPEDVGLAAALGVGTLRVRRRLKAAILSTGDELVEPGRPLKPPAAHDANRYMIGALLRRQGVDILDLGIVPDERTAIAAALGRAGEGADLIITSGGVSVGEEDHVRAAILEQGSLDFWRLAVKPGRPLAMGIVGGKPLVGLPGNPVAAFIGFVFVARALIAALLGASFEPPRASSVVAGFAHAKKPGRREFVRVSLRRTDAGASIAEKEQPEGAAALASLTRTRGFVDLSEDLREVAPGQAVAFIDFDLIR